MKAQNLARQGDILLVRVAALPSGLRLAKNNVVALGEVTGHSHKVVGGGASVLEDEAGAKYVDSSEAWKLVHDEHAEVDLEPGIYEVRRQVEYTPAEIRQVAD